LRCLLALFAFLALSSVAVAEPRIALVIGNSNYGGELGQLPNPANDARLMAKTLKAIGFTVIEAENADQPQMKRVIQDFGGKLAESGGGATGLFFYAGHGLQVGGTNYLIPVRANIENERDVDIEAVAVDVVMKQMGFAGSAVNIVILDACRNNPLSRGFRAVTRGLADPSVRPEGSFIAYSTAPGDVAEDGNGGNSPFTAALAAAMTKPGASINDVFQEVRGQVRAATNRKQIPWDSSSLTAPFYFVPAAVTPPVGAVTTDPQAIELAFWNDVKDSNSAEDYQAYLDKFPDGAFAPLAKLRLKQADQGASRILHANPADAPKSTEADPSAFEDAFWGAAEDDKARESYQAYINRYPKGRYADQARARVAAMDKAPSPDVAAATAKLYVRDKARLRAEPAADAAIVARLDAGMPIDADGRSVDGAWWRVKLADGRSGFISASVVTDQPPSPAPVSAAAMQTPVPEKAPDPEIAAAAKVPQGQEHDLCLKGGNRPSAERAVACRRFLAAGVSDATERYNADLALGDALFDIGKLDEALTAYRAAIDVDPQYYSAYDAAGAVLLSQEKDAEAETAFDKAVSLQPDTALSLYQRGTARANLGRFEAARDDLKRAIALKSDDTSYYDQLGAVQMALGDLDAAADTIDTAVNAASDYWSGTGMLVSYLTGRFDRVRFMADLGKKQQPDYLYFAIWTALAEKASGAPAAAKAALAEAVRAGGNQAWPMPIIDYLAGRVSESRLRSLAASGDAKTRIQRLCEVDFYTGEVAYLAGDKATARSHFQAAAASGVFRYLELAAAKARLTQIGG
jgi:lipoprotein NlpI